MRAKEEIKERLTRNLDSTLSRLEEKISIHLDRMRKAESVEEIMYEKREILLAWLECLPLHPDHCYFCIQHLVNNCTRCRYKDFHGKCIQPDSHYAEINDAKKQLLSKIANYYLHETY